MSVMLLILLEFLDVGDAFNVGYAFDVVGVLDVGDADNALYVDVAGVVLRSLSKQ
jgi:hypothetical protein